VDQDEINELCRLRDCFIVVGIAVLDFIAIGVVSVVVLAVWK